MVIFGFSRGAYTARSLSGRIAKCGLLTLGAPLSVKRLYDRYRLGSKRQTPASTSRTKARLTSGHIGLEGLDEAAVDLGDEDRASVAAAKRQVGRVFSP